MLNGNCSAQTFVAADYATTSTYATAWSAGQNGGYGFGPWSFSSTDQTPAGQYQEMSTNSALGRSWTLATYALHTGIANCGRAISGPGLQPGQTLELVIQNPTGYYFYRGFDICCLNGTGNNPGGVNTAAIRTQAFAYFNMGDMSWVISDNDPASTTTPLNITNTASAGMKYALTITSTNTYSLTLTPLGDPSSAYSQSGTLTTNLPINWINLRLYWGISSGPTDTTNNFEISTMVIKGLTLNIQQVNSNVVLSWPTNFPGFNLISTTNLGAAAVWNPVSLQSVVVNDQNFYITNPIVGPSQFYRLQSQ